MHIPRPNLIIINALLALAIAGAVVAQPSFTEDFTTTAYKSSMTSADWNTAAGELRLYPFAPRVIDTYDTPTDASGVALAGHLALVADGSSGLLVFNVTSNISTLLGSYDTPGYALDVSVSGNLAFVADNTAGVHIIDFSDPASPALVGTYATPTYAFDVAVDGDLLFIAGGENGLLVVDISTPATPTLVSTLNTPGSAHGVAVSGKLVLVADQLAGLQLITIANPSFPALCGTYNTPGNARDVVVSGGLAYVADFTSGLQVIDIRSCASPALVGTYSTTDRARQVAVSGNRVYIADGNAGLHVVDVTNPASPALVHTYDTTGHTREVAVARERAYVADAASGLRQMHIREIAAPLPVGSYTSAYTNYTVEVSGNLALMGTDDGIEIIDVTTPSNPVLVGTYSTPGSVRRLDVVHNFAFLAESDSSLRIVNLTNPAAPVLVSAFDTPGEIRDVEVAGDYAFVADGTMGLQVVDISNLAIPAVIGSYDTPGFALGVAVSGNTALVADHTTGVVLVDITNPTAPVLAGTLPSAGYPSGIEVSGLRAYVTAGLTGVEVVDFFDPSSPVLRGTYDPGSAAAVRISGNLAFVAATTSGLRVIGVGTPCCPYEVGTYDPMGETYNDLDLSGEHVFVVNSVNKELKVFQVFQDEFDAAKNRGQSYYVDGASDMIVRARIMSTETAGISWELSADLGSGWVAAVADNSWVPLTPGTDLLWRSTHSWAGTNPTISSFTLEWLNEFAWITAIRDIGSDQGRQVHVEWRRSGRDFVGDAQQIVEYAVYRRVDPGVSVSMRAAGMTEPSASSAAIEGASPALRQHVTAASAAGWHFITTVPVRVEDDYAVVVPTLTDSTITAGQYYSTFMVSALTATPGVFFDSPPDSGYSVDNLAPDAPQNLAAAYNSGGNNQLSWDAAPEPDFKTFRIYRDTDPNFVVSAGSYLGATGVPAWTDAGMGGGVYYKITSVDHSGNESDPTAPSLATAARRPALPDAFALYQNHPNPFNPATTIRYNVPAGGGDVTLEIFDVGGRRVKTLVDGAQTAGEKRAEWDGRNDRGRSVASGVYFYRLITPVGEFSRKMTLLE